MVVDSILFRSGLNIEQKQAIHRLRAALPHNDVSENQQQKLIHHVLVSIFTVEHGLSTKWANPMECYFPIKFVKRDGSFTPAFAVTSELAAYKFVMRATILQLLNERVLNPTAPSPDTSNAESATDIMARWVDTVLYFGFNRFAISDVRPYLRWVHPTQSTAFGVITHLSGLATAITKSTPRSPNTFWSDAETLTVDGTTIKMSQIRKGFAGMISTASDILNNSIFFGLPLHMPKLHSDHIKDRINAHHSGYSLWDEPDNPFYQ
jgi:hypothetical protein